MVKQYLSEYIIADPDEQLAAFFDKVPFFNSCLEKQGELDERMIKEVSSILYHAQASGDDVTAYETALLETFTPAQTDLYRQAKKDPSSKPASYEVLQALGYVPEQQEVHQSSPLNFLYALQKKQRLKARGLSDNNKGKLNLEPNTFAKYLLKRLPLVQSTKGEYFYYNDGKYEVMEPNVLKTLCRDILNEAGQTIWNRNFELNYMAAFAHEIPFVSAFDDNPDVINFSNGLFNIETGAFQEHTPEHYSVKQLPYAYNSEADCPRFKTFLEDIFEGDQERIDLIQQLLGYCWLQEIRIHKSFIFLGSGSNGKSVLAKVMQHLYGHFNVSATSLADFEGRFGLQDLTDKLVNISSENEFTKDFSTENLKVVTSGDATSVERKHNDAFTTTLHVKLVVLLNRMMDSADNTEGFMRRLQIIPFNKRFVELKQGEEPIEGVSYMDPHLVDKLLEELPGIFNFALEGLQELKGNNFNLPFSSECEEALDRYKRHQNPVISFIDDMISYSPDDRLLRSSISQAFQDWHKAHEPGMYRKLSNPRMLTAFKDDLAKRGWPIEEVKVNGHYYLKHIKLKDVQSNSSDYVSPTY